MLSVLGMFLRGNSGFLPFTKESVNRTKKAMGIRKQSFVPLSKSFVVVFRRTNLGEREKETLFWLMCKSFDYFKSRYRTF